ncbi:sugar ABC transporter permease [Actinomyces polynesiensis]|uniref:sugar ABC transporter permease n=1 Tax=Actinomyces polynesiensis TaxID=1325934 RepID=UPI0009E238F9|nr:ABC transporter permease subunit [Actinomyces polynesiensis]
MSAPGTTPLEVGREEGRSTGGPGRRTRRTTRRAPEELHTSLKGLRWWAEVGWRHIVGVVAIIYCVVPLLYVLSVSLVPNATLTGSNRLFATFSTQNFSALSGTEYWSWIRNSLVVSISTAVGTVLMGASAAYAFSRFRFRGRRGTLTFLLLVQMFPQMLAFVALFLLLLSLQDVFPALGLNSQLGLICVYLGGALGSNTFLLYGFFNTVPKELDEAAEIDGASHAQVFWTIILPLVLPVLAVVGLLSFIASFGDFVIARVVLQTPDRYTLAVGMYNWAADARTAPWGLFAAGAVVAAVPVVLIFLYLQRYIVSGLTAGSVKG